MTNVADIIKGSSYTFRAAIRGAVGTETMKLVVGKTDGSARSLLVSLNYDSTFTFGPYRIPVKRKDGISTDGTLRAVASLFFKGVTE